MGRLAIPHNQYPHADKRAGLAATHIPWPHTFGMAHCVHPVDSPVPTDSTETAAIASRRLVIPAGFDAGAICW